MSVAESASRRGTLWSESATVTVRPLGHAPRCAFLAFTGSHGEAFSLPKASVISGWLDTLTEWGYGQVRTNAVIASENTALQEVGFTVIQELALLSISHWTPTACDVALSRASQPRKAVRFGWLRGSVREEILRLDAQAFGPDWCLDNDLLHDALSATTRSQVFVVREANVLQGFVIVGMSGDTGYVQRLAVADDRRNCGIGAALVSTALNWAQRCGCTHTVVNTEVTNLAALRLYEKIGFVSLPNRLTVLHKELR